MSFSHFVFSLLSLLLSIQHVFSSPTPIVELEERGSCNENNLLRALQATSRTKDSYPFCSSYISIPATVTKTIFTSTSTFTNLYLSDEIIHPVQYINFNGISSATPIKYNSPSPSPITVDPYTYGNPYNRRREALPTSTIGYLEPRATTSSLPSYVATYPPASISSACSCLSVPAATTETVSTYLYTEVESNSTCTSYYPSTWATYPAVCLGSALANAATVSSHTAVQTVSKQGTGPITVASKSDCCYLCASTLNCVWWKFNFATLGKPWAGGTCIYAYHTDVGKYYNEVPPVCPNGQVDITFSNINLTGQVDYYALTLPGYNFGPCASGVVGEYQSSEDYGLPNYQYNPDCPAGYQ